MPTPREFLADPKAQDAVFNHQFGSYVQKYGNVLDAASAWFTGSPRTAASGAAADITGTTGNEYVAKFARSLSGGAAPSPSATYDPATDPEVVKSMRSEITADANRHWQTMQEGLKASLPPSPD